MKGYLAKDNDYNRKIFFNLSTIDQEEYPVVVDIDIDVSDFNKMILDNIKNKMVNSINDYGTETYRRVSKEYELSNGEVKKEYKFMFNDDNTDIVEVAVSERGVSIMDEQDTSLHDVKMEELVSINELIRNLSSSNGT